MKKQLAVALLAFVSAAAMADNFVGPAVGLDTGVTKFKAKDEVTTNGKNMSDTNLSGSYGFAYGDTPLVGMVEGKVKLGSSKAFAFDDEGGDIKQKNGYSLGYQQGFKVTNDFMPYVGVHYQHAKFKDTEDGETDRANGFGVSVGAKYQVMPNVELNAEYRNTHLRTKKDDFGDRVRLRGNTFSVGSAYRF